MPVPQPSRRFGDDIVGVVIEKELSNKTPLHRSAGHISIECPICGIAFSRKASEAKRHAANYCSNACRYVSYRRQVKRACRVCGREYSVKQSVVDSITCCSSACRSKALSESTSEKNVAGWKVGMYGIGETTASAKLTNIQVKTILADLRGDAAIAKDYGVTRQTIRNIKTRKTWRHLPGSAAA